LFFRPIRQSHQLRFPLSTNFRGVPYYRKCFRAKLGRTTVELPIDGGKVDYAFMERMVKAQPYWWFLEPRLGKWSPRSTRRVQTELATGGVESKLDAVPLQQPAP
jgi:hypothetical protein